MTVRIANGQLVRVHPNRAGTSHQHSVIAAGKWERGLIAHVAKATENLAAIADHLTVRRANATDLQQAITPDRARTRDHDAVVAAANPVAHVAIAAKNLAAITDLQVVGGAIIAYREDCIRG